MQNDRRIFDGCGTEVFAGIPVRDLRTALEWYQRLFGCAPAFFPNEREAVWAIGDKRWIYIIVEPGRAGGTVQTIMCNNLEQVIAAIAGRGLEFKGEENPGPGVRKVLYYDPDGNEIGIGRVPS